MVRTTLLSSVTILVEWQEIAELERNGVITGYEVLYSYPQGPSQVDSMTELSTTLRNLAESELYTVQVRGVTSAGPGPYSGPVQTMTDNLSTYVHTVDTVDSNPSTSFVYSPFLAHNNLDVH